MIPQEQHEQEQYFFRGPTAAALCCALAAFDRPCVLCAPLVGAQLARRRNDVRILDIDRRFESVPGFAHWDVLRPRFLNERFGVIFCDPPFFSVSLSRLFRSVRMLARADFATPLAITYLSRRADAIRSAFGPFDLRPTGYRPEYLTVENSGRGAIEVFANFDCPLWDRGFESPTPGGASCHPTQTPASQ